MCGKPIVLSALSVTFMFLKHFLIADLILKCRFKVTHTKLKVYDSKLLQK